MAICEMRRVTVIGHRTYREQALGSLQDLGMVQVINLRDSVSPEDWAEYFDAGEATGASSGARRSESGHDERLAEVKYSIDLIQRFNKEKKSLLDQLAGTKLALSREDFESNVADGQFGRELYEKSRAIEERLAELSAREAHLQGLLAALDPWSALDVPLQEIVDTRSVRLALGLVAGRDASAFQAEVESLIPEAVIQVAGLGDQAALFLAYHKGLEDEMTALTRKYDFTPVSFAGLSGTPLEASGYLREQLEQIAREREGVVQEVKRLADARTRLYSLYDHFALLREKDEAAGNLGETATVFVLECWVKAQDLPRLEAAITRVSDTIFLESRPPLDDEDYPVDLENKSFWNPFEAVTKIAGLPKAGAIDPTPYLAPFFFIFFGITLGDAGYGIALIVLSYWLVKRLKPQGMGRQLIMLLGVCGISTLFIGALTGSWFGDLFGLKALWFDPTKEPLKMLALSLVLGVIHIFTGLGIKLADNVKRGQVWDAILDQGMWLILLSGLAMLLVSGSLQSPAVLSAGKGFSVVGALGIVLFSGRASKNIFARLGSGLYNLYGVSAYMSDVLSYARLLALGLSGSVVAVVFNLLAKMTLPVPVVGVLFMVAILAAGHAFNLIISIISSFVHSSRLQYVEFYGKFYEGGGKRFKPLGVNTKYTQVNRTEEA